MAYGRRNHGKETYHHVYARGNDRHPIFKAPQHYVKYVQLLEHHARIHFIDVVAYALMQSHIHLFIYDDQDTISKFMWMLHGDYSKYYNKNAGRLGHVFGERYQNKIVVTNTYGLWLSRYIHRQAVEAKLIELPEQYPWTSYRAYLGWEKSFIKPGVILKQFEAGYGLYRDYRQFVMMKRNDEGKKCMHFFSDNGNVICAFEAVCDELHIELERLLEPVNREDLIVRRKAVVKLYENYRLKQQEIAQLLGLTRIAIYYIMNKKVT